jgi:alkylation response protein AidB-like acyl-CoA dehydrogenase
MAAATYAMEAMTHVTAGLIDSGLEDYMLETAILKVYSTEVLWTIVNDAFQIHGGSAYFTDRPLERMLRDARINQIGEGANEVLISFIGLLGMRGPGERLQSIAQSLRKPLSAGGAVASFVTTELQRRLVRPAVPGVPDPLQSAAAVLSRLIQRFATEVQRQLIHYRDAILDRQLLHERIANAAIELYASSCVLSRRTAELHRSDGDQSKALAANLFLSESARRFHRAVDSLRDNDDQLIRATADSLR